MNQKDYYQILGVDRDTPQQKIREAYRKLAFQYHPDQNKDNPSAVEKMKEINEAYAVLSDSNKKEKYDTFALEYGPSAYDRFKQSYSEQDIFRGSDINQVFEEMTRSFGFRNFEEVFRESYGQGYRTFEFRRPGVFGRGFIFYGPGFGRRQKKVDRSEGPTSPPIQFGFLGKLIQYAVKTTLGIGSYEKGKNWEEVITLDPQLALEGGKIKYLHRRKSKELVIAIPSGIKEGQKIRLKGMGAEGKNGGEPGDLYLKVQIRRPFSNRIKELLSPWLFRRVP
jgi:DnaJ-class molecular chaperone